tara:strand:- start:1278 stop:1586 length:309 start_codon:yes stop_codon:yes gene_type:complete
MKKETTKSSLDDPTCSAIRFERLLMYRTYDGSIKGTLSIESDDGSEVKITLPDEPLESIVDLVADKLAEAAKVQADRLRDAILNRQNVTVQPPAEPKPNAVK